MSRSTLDKLKALLLGSRRRGGCRTKNSSKLSSRQPDQESVVCVSEEDEKIWELVMVDPLVATQISEKSCEKQPSFAVLSENVDVSNLCLFGTCGHSCVGFSCEESEKSSEGTEFSSLGSFEEERKCGSLDDVDSDDSGSSGTTAYTVCLQESARKLTGTIDLPALCIPGTCLPEGVKAEDVMAFRESYQNHCESILESAAKFTLGHIKSLWVNFWEGLESDPIRCGGFDPNKSLSLREKMFFMCEFKPVQQYVNAADMRVYQKIVEILVPDLWVPIPENVAVEIWKFTKRFEGWMNVAMEGYSSEIVSLKLSSVAAFSRELQNTITLNQLGKKLSLVLQNKEQTNLILEDFSRLNFRGLEEEATWFCGPNQSLFMGVKRVVEDCLLESLTMQQWATRVEGVCNRMLPSNSLCGSQLFEALKEVVLENLFYTELILQALDAGDKKSVEPLALLMKVYNSYVYYLSKQLLAKAVGILPVAVMTKDFMNVKSSEGRVHQTEDVYPDTSPESEKPGCYTSVRAGDKKLLPENHSTPAVSQLVEGSSFTPRSARRWQMNRFSPVDDVKGRQYNFLQDSPVSQQRGTPPFLLSRCPW